MKSPESLHEIRIVNLCIMSRRNVSVDNVFVNEDCNFCAKTQYYITKFSKIIRKFCLQINTLYYSDILEFGIRC